ncbi:hypothetical protein BYT27DRAFT_7184067 [Phlegmacium glaucopus]|nr:hypothetical protein BYT27DRAFT_7204693 [Phlegmacium glaucopus]KAF8811450.1 hypothetical protein BYT27DRAFT_7184343 [Phlegmacium glaucopus]KAF8811500.1 hypothetical protein BYT27DRAFT_7184067 [Phlegmacium glaucopus]
MEDGGDVVVKNGSVSAHRMSRYTIYRLELISQPEHYLAASVSFVLAMASRVPMGIRVGNSVDVLQ